MGVVMGAEHQRPPRAAGNSSGKKKQSSSGAAGPVPTAQGQWLGLGVHNNHGLGFGITSASHNLLMPSMVEMQGMEQLVLGGMKGPMVDVKDLLRHGKMMFIVFTSS